MLLYRRNRLRAIAGGMVLRYCEGRYGVTRREWVMLALLSTGESLQPSRRTGWPSGWRSCRGRIGAGAGRGG